MNYKHTQKSHLIVSVSIILALFLGLFIVTGDLSLLYIGVFILFLIMFLFSSLTVEIDDTYLRIGFTNNIIRKKFLLSEIKSVRQVKNHWYYGWGIRIWFWPKMWIFNISGFDAVEIVMLNGSIYRIGSDDVVELEKMINVRLKK